MPSFRTTRRVDHSPDQMFDLVADVERYPEFVPMCTALRVRRRSEEDGVEIIVAEMKVGYKSIHETFTSRIVLDRAKLAINVAYIDGPFSHMDNRWKFHPEPADEPKAPASEIDFYIDYQFKSRMLGLLMGGMFDVAFRRFTRAFQARADIVYGRPAVTSL